jgi:hypothetical protein
MNDDDYIDWFQDNYDVNVELFIEKMSDEFEEYCLNRFTQLGQDRFEDYYEEKRLKDMEDKNEN